MTCPFGTMDWYCCLAAGHAGPHESHELPPDTSTNPPSVPSLDVEACVRLLTHFAAQEEARAEFMDEQARKILCMNTAYTVDRERENAAEYRAQAAQLRALASALPGMGKAIERASHPMPRNVADHVRTMYDMKYEELSDDPYEDAEGLMGIGEKHERSLMTACTVLRHWIATGDVRHYRDIDAARAAQPEETSADERP